MHVVAAVLQGSSTPRADGNSGGGGSSAAAAAAAAGAPLASVGVSLVEFGKQLISGTKEVIDTVRGGRGGFHVVWSPPSALSRGARCTFGDRACVRCATSSAMHILHAVLATRHKDRAVRSICTAGVLLMCICCALQVTEMVEGGPIAAIHGTRM
jgi:hypothetical protein